MKHIRPFENFLNEEVDSSLMGGIAKNLYLELKKKPINQITKPMKLNGLKEFKDDLLIIKTGVAIK